METKNCPRCGKPVPPGAALGLCPECLLKAGTGSSVAPYVLLELYYRGVAPIAMVNTEIDQQMAPACSLEGIPYAYSFDLDVNNLVKDGDEVALERRGDHVYLRVLNRG